jgi:hypothetical protein
MIYKKQLTFGSIIKGFSKFRNLEGDGYDMMKLMSLKLEMIDHELFAHFQRHQTG